LEFGFFSLQQAYTRNTVTHTLLRHFSSNCFSGNSAFNYLYFFVLVFYYLSV